MPRAEVAAVVLPDVHVAEPLADLVDRPDQVVLLDVHVVRVEVDGDVVGTDVVGQPQRVSGRVDDVGLVAIADLQPEGDAAGGGLLGRTLQHPDDVPAAGRGQGRGYLPSAEYST